MENRLVDANEVKENILGVLDIMREVSGDNNLVDAISNAVCSCIEVAETVEPVKQGKWLRNNFPSASVLSYLFAYECSVCGQRQDIPTKHCSSCGAKMGDE